jgi:hypothetical protein
MTVLLRHAEHGALLSKLWPVLTSEPDPVKQQAAIELLTATHALRMDDQAKFVADSVHKHVLQILGQRRS